ncbi:MAG: UDP-glucose/GDP-mannose dehydrogenase family protein [Actinomycetota bacterium]
MQLAVIGTGRVGLVTCVSMAAVGHDVIGTDADEEKVQLLQQGKPPIFEPGLDDLLREGLDSGRIRFTPDTAEAVAGAEVVFICVGTPLRDTGEANLVEVERAVRAVARGLTGPAVIVTRSTVPTGASRMLSRTLTRERPDLEGHIEVASNPEFLRGGKALDDALRPVRVLVGAGSEHAFEVLREVYRPIVGDGIPLIETDIPTAELAKHACNAFLALKISYVNALARLCERSGADVVAVADVMGVDARIGRNFLNAGLGYGGYSLPKDLQAFERVASQLNYDFRLLREIGRINDEAIETAFATITEALWNVEGKTVTLLGLAFKPGTDSVRLSPALALARKLLAAGATVIGYDPKAGSNAKDEVPQLELAPDPYEAVAGAHCAVVCTQWPELAGLDLERIKTAMLYPVIVDGRNVFDPRVMAGAGFNYYPTGRPSV